MALAIVGVYNSDVLAAPKNRRNIFSYADAAPVIVMWVEALRARCDDYDVPLVAAAIDCPVPHLAVTCVVIGANTPAQLRQNVDWLDSDLPEVI